MFKFKSTASSSTPSLSRTSSSSSSSSTFNDFNSSDDAALSITTLHEDDLPRLRERSLRQRSTTAASSAQLPPSSATHVRDEDSLSSGEENELNEKVDKNATSTSWLMGSSFFMGPHHVFSTPELRTPRVRKESNDYGKGADGDAILSLDVEKSSPSKSKVVYRRGGHGSLLRSPSSGSALGGTSFSDVDLEKGDDTMNGLTPLIATKELSKHTPISPPQYSSTLARRNQPNNQPQRNNTYAFVLRSREQVIIHLLMESKMLRTDLLFILFITFYQFFHSAVTNVAYYQHAQLNAANRVPLKDLAFDMLPPLDGDLWIISEYILFAILAISISCILSTLVVRWNAPHGRPIYAVQIVRRLGMTWIVCQTLRMISFLVTTLPGASRQCRYAVPDELTAFEMLNGPAPDGGNPAGWAPPTTLQDVLFRVDATNGCGDLMFSSHTIYTMSFVCVVFKYFNFKSLKAIMALLQISIVPFILAARKHYSVDVFTALYVTPLVFELLWTRCPDLDTSVALANHYGIRFYLAQEGQDSFSYVVNIWGKEYYVDEEQLPIDIAKESMLSGKEVETERSTAIIV
mmetsp:Transcript_18031/g.38913  ORF Transcript_18031/g.38913 Transcript_18031/m.38913 type:complete len:575 (-) Transcript_18031:821-2545(-)